MAKSRLGKKASRKLAVENMKKLIDSKFENVAFSDKKALFIDLENWARETMNSESCEIFLEALYGAKTTQDIQLEIGVEKALEKVFGGK